MGQYYYVVNIDKKQFLHPHKFGHGLKLLEFGCSAGGTLLGLACLLADGNGRGGGDLYHDENHPDAGLIGSWAGDRIVVAGDYGDAGRFLPAPEDWNKEDHGDPNLHTIACETFEDISDRVLRVLRSDTTHELADDLPDPDENPDGWRQTPAGIRAAKKGRKNARLREQRRRKKLGLRPLPPGVHPWDHQAYAPYRFDS